MGRGKVQLRLIENGSSRRSMYKKRLAGLKKKAYQISKLCDVSSLVISVDLDGKVETFPENKDEVLAILDKYNSISNKVGEKYKQNSESVIQSQILKKQLELKQLRMENEKEVSATVKFLDSMLMEVQGRILLQSYMHDFASEKEMENVIDAGKLNGDEFEEMVIAEPTQCNGHGGLPNLIGIDEFRGLPSMNGMQLAISQAGCHEHIEDSFKESYSSVGGMNEPQIVTHLVAVESDQPTEESAHCNGHGDLNLIEVEELLRRYEALFDDMSDMQMATKEAGCHGRNDSFLVEDLIERPDSSGADMNGPQDVTHLAAEEPNQSNMFSCDLPNLTEVEELLRWFDASFDVMNDKNMAIKEADFTHLEAEKVDRSNAFSGSCNEFLEHVPNSMCYADDDHPCPFELSDFINF